MQKHPNFSFQQIPAPLISWYHAHKRDLPWRKNPTPYRVWVSEIMLQQTRVEAVKEYYVRFMQQLPTLQDLAACEEEQLLKLWEGLGYYSRVRNMQKAARQILLYHDGEFPQTKQELLRLSGIGSYTAGAILSIAFKQKEPAVDGNVFRVISRLSKDATPLDDATFRAYLEMRLGEVYPDTKEDCSAFTQGLFELGATVCKPQNPDCAVCPLAHLCQAKKDGEQHAYPVRAKKKEKRAEQVYVFLIQTPEGFCIRRREQGVLRGMNEFPSRVYDNGETAENVLNEWGMYAFTEVNRRKFKHVFTHIVWDITCVWVQMDSAPFDTYQLSEIEESISLPTAFRQCLQMIK